MARRGGWKPYGQVVELEIQGTGPRGEGLAQLDSVRYRVWDALPGERVLARIVGRERGWRLSRAEEILAPSPARIVPRCPVFGECGGCSWQNLAYGDQLALLEGRVRAQLTEAGVALDDAEWAPIEPSARTWHYRGKIELSFGGEAGNLRLGFNRRGRWWDVVDVEDCLIGPPVNAELISRVRAWADVRGHAPYHQRSRQGFLRYLVIRQALSTSPERWLAALVTTTPSSEAWGRDELTEAVADVTPSGSLLWVTSDAPAGAVTVQKSELLTGDGRLVERLGAVEYVLGLESFFQANSLMARRLVTIVRERALAGPHGYVVDLFTGVGTIALALADSCGRVVGVESVAPAVLDAQANARAHGWDHVRFLEARAERYAWDPDIDLLILDPPRSGLHPRLPRRLVESPVPRVLYVSCNPEALAHDLAQVRETYAVKYVQCVDMFPHTPHVETIVELARIQH